MVCQYVVALIFAGDTFIIIKHYQLADISQKLFQHWNLRQPYPIELYKRICSNITLKKHWRLVLAISR